MNNQAPFLDVSSFIMEEVSEDTLEPSAPPVSPFLSLYESEESGDIIDPETEEYVQFLNELYDEEFDEALFDLASEASALFETRFMHEPGDSETMGYEAERLLAQHFAPLVAEAEAMLETLATELSQRDAAGLTEDEIEAIVDRYQPSAGLAPSFENFLKKIKKAVKKVAKKAAGLAKKGISLAAKLSLGPVLKMILNKLKPLIKPLLRRVIQTAIGRLPARLQPIARKLTARLRFLREIEEGDEFEPETAQSCEIAAMQHEFNQHLANLLFAHSEVEQDLEIAEALSEEDDTDSHPLAELDHARARFVEKLRGMKDDDPTPHVEEFVPAILPALRVGIRLIGRKRVVNFLAKLLAGLIRKFVGPKYAPALSQAIVDAGLRLIQLEATAEDEPQAAASAVAATIEETVRRVAALPDYVLDDQELLEDFALEAFEQAAAANLPPILPEEVYQKRPDLSEAKELRGVWIMMPRGRRKRYKKYSRKVATKLTPHKVTAIETFEGIPLQAFLEEELGVMPGEQVEAVVHLYESIPGARLPDIARLEKNTPGLGVREGYEQLHPLTREAAALLLGEPQLGREVDHREPVDPYTAAAGQRFYYLEIPGRRPYAGPGRSRARRPSRLRLIFDFPKNEIRVFTFLSEIRAQEVVVKLRRQAGSGALTARLRGFIAAALRSALTGKFGRLKIIHEAVMPDRKPAALRRLPPVMTEALFVSLHEWIFKALADYLRHHAQEFIKAAEDRAEGVTLVINLSNPPGFPQLRQALKGKTVSLSSLMMLEGKKPTVTIKISPGLINE